MNRKTNKKQYNYSALFWDSNFQDSLLENLKIISLMVLGPGGRDHDSPNQLSLIWGTPRSFKQTRKAQNIFEHIMLGNLKISNIEKLEMCVSIILQHVLDIFKTLELRRFVTLKICNI